MKITVDQTYGNTNDRDKNNDDNDSDEHTLSVMNSDNTYSISDEQ